MGHTFWFDSSPSLLISKGIFGSRLSLHSPPWFDPYSPSWARVVWIRTPIEVFRQTVGGFRMIGGWWHMTVTPAAKMLKGVPITGDPHCWGHQGDPRCAVRWLLTEYSQNLGTPSREGLRLSVLTETEPPCATCDVIS